MIDTQLIFKDKITPGLDPDSHSPTLKEYHKIIWSKQPLPCGQFFDLSDEHPRAYLYHKSDLGEFSLSSDAILHSYLYVNTKNDIGCKKYWPDIIDKKEDVDYAYKSRWSGIEIRDQLHKKDIEEFWRTVSNISGYILFPSYKVDNKDTINMARGKDQKICDRFDLTLECIRLFYEGEQNPLSDTLQRYELFFKKLFKSFKGYVDFFLLQDLVDDDYKVKFFLEFDKFNRSPLPQNVKEYLKYKDNVIDFAKARTKRIEGLNL